ncbi:hypothetical protein DM01DRAFT_1403779 [Hesseltinella vesiculosa]|uniref:Uncharacterized protein n=1 Tax=Hesseltinella vesiculosa TaxID=101127 RepID=A0A1X2GVK1_9FUNG|nr:hypothetical protein DM01DRAFT_1403779 [Hesseltinella vesiculosa]
MAFIQQRQRPPTSTPALSSDTEDAQSLSSYMDTSFPSDSDTDWHVINQQLSPLSRPRQRRDSAPSEPESLSSYRPSDIESYTDTDDPPNIVFSNLPAHDGTGAFVIDTSDEDVPATASLRDFQPSSSSMPNILLPHGGIRAPSFAQDDTPYFKPTVPQEILTVQNDDETQTKPCRDLDTIPGHHPSLFPMTSLAILSALWDNLRRLTTHWLDDTNASDTFTTLVAEATLEGCLPFSSPLYMELPTIQPT